MAPPLVEFKPIKRLTAMAANAMVWLEGTGSAARVTSSYNCARFLVSTIWDAQCNFRNVDKDDDDDYQRCRSLDRTKIIKLLA